MKQPAKLIDTLCPACGKRYLSEWKKGQTEPLLRKCKPCRKNGLPSQLKVGTHG